MSVKVKQLFYACFSFMAISFMWIDDALAMVACVGGGTDCLDRRPLLKKLAIVIVLLVVFGFGAGRMFRRRRRRRLARKHLGNRDD